MTVRVSVVVPTYKRPDLLSRCLSALLAQDFDPSAYEVVVADDAASAETRALVEKWATQARPAVRYVAVTGVHGPAAARNAGWRAAAAEIVAFTDDDCVPDPGWLRDGAAAFADGVAAVWGQVRMPLPPRPTDYERNESGLETAEFVTANCFCRRQALLEVGGFDERFGMAWREDSDLYFSLLEKGKRVERAPAAVVVHPVRPGRWGISLKQQRKSVYNALLYKKHPELYRHKIRPGTPWHYYGITGALAGVAAGAALAQPIVITAAGAVWLFLTGRFLLRRLRGTSHAPKHVAEMAVTSVLIPPLSVFWRLRGAVRFGVLFW